MAVTATQIKAVLDTALAAAKQTLRTYDYTITDKRRQMPYLVITIPTRSEDKDIRKITYSQRFRLVLVVRQRGMAEAEVQFQDTIEPIILSALDGTTLGGDRLFVENKDWTRNQKIIMEPLPHYESTLDVYVTDIQSQSGSGTIIARSSVDLPGLAGMQLLSMPMGPNRMGNEDVFSTDKRRVYVAPTGHSRAILFEIEATPARRNSIDGMIRAKAPVSATIHKGADSETVTCTVVEMDDGGGYSDLETLIIRLEVFDS